MFHREDKRQPGDNGGAEGSVAEDSVVVEEGAGGTVRTLEDLEHLWNLCVCVCLKVTEKNKKRKRES